MCVWWWAVVRGLLDTQHEGDNKHPVLCTLLLHGVLITAITGHNWPVLQTINSAMQATFIDSSAYVQSVLSQSGALLWPSLEPVGRELVDMGHVLSSTRTSCMSSANFGKKLKYMLPWSQAIHSQTSLAHLTIFGLKERSIRSNTQRDKRVRITSTTITVKRQKLHSTQLSHSSCWTEGQS